MDWGFVCAICFLALVCFVGHISKAPYQPVASASRDGRQQNTPFITAGSLAGDAYRLGVDEEVFTHIELVINKDSLLS